MVVGQQVVGTEIGPRCGLKHGGHPITLLQNNVPDEHTTHTCDAYTEPGGGTIPVQVAAAPRFTDTTAPGGTVTGKEEVVYRWQLGLAAKNVICTVQA
jgi:hypothetical protein